MSRSLAYKGAWSLNGTMPRAMHVSRIEALTSLTSLTRSLTSTVSSARTGAGTRARIATGYWARWKAGFSL